MPAQTNGAPAPRRRPEQLLLAFFGELVVDRGLGAVPAAVLLEVLGELSVGAAAGRATLARMVSRGLLERVPSGRSVSYLLTPTSEEVLREARDRVFATDPFAPDGEGWTLVTFSVPESQRDVRHRVRAQLVWAGFGILRDGLWIAPGAVDVGPALGPLRAAEQGDAGLELLAFRATEIEGFPVAAAMSSAWRLDEIRARHEEFQATWRRRTSDDDGLAAVCTLTALVADWLGLLRAAPRLPAEHLGPDWPTGGSVETFRRWHDVLAPRARTALRERLDSTQ